MNVFEQIRTFLPATSRGRVYTAVSLLAPAFIAWGVFDELQAAAVVGVVVAVVTLFYAIAHGTSKVINAVYGLVAAGTVALTVWGFGSPEQWQSLLAVLAPVLGVTLAAQRTPTISDEDIVWVDDEPVAEVSGESYVGEHRLDGEVQ